MMTKVAKVDGVEITGTEIDPMTALVSPAVGDVWVYPSLEFHFGILDILRNGNLIIVSRLNIDSGFDFRTAREITLEMYRSLVTSGFDAERFIAIPFRKLPNSDSPSVIRWNDSGRFYTPLKNVLNDEDPRHHHFESFINHIALSGDLETHYAVSNFQTKYNPEGRRRYVSEASITIGKCGGKSFRLHSTTAVSLPEQQAVELYKDRIQLLVKEMKRFFDRLSDTMPSHSLLSTELKPVQRMVHLNKNSHVYSSATFYYHIGLDATKTGLEVMMKISDCVNTYSFGETLMPFKNNQSVFVYLQNIIKALEEHLSLIDVFHTLTV